MLVLKQQGFVDSINVDSVHEYATRNTLASRHNFRSVNMKVHFCQPASAGICSLQYEIWLWSLCGVKLHNHHHKTILLTGQAYILKFVTSRLHAIRLTNSNPSPDLIELTDASIPAAVCSLVFVNGNKTHAWGLSSSPKIV